MDPKEVNDQFKRLTKTYHQLCSEIFAQAEHLSKENVRIIEGIKYIPMNDYILRLRSTRHRIMSELKRVEKIH